MVSGSRKLTIRALGVVVAAALTLVSFAVFFDTSGAANSIVPQAGASGHEVFGFLGSEPVDYSTSVFVADLGMGAQTSLFTTGLDRRIELGVGYEESQWGDQQIPDSARVAHVLSLSSAAQGSTDRTEIAATQAAIWHFADGFELNSDDDRNEPAVISRYRELVSAASAVADETPSGSIAIVAQNPESVGDEPIYLDITSTVAGLLSVEVAHSDVTLHPVADGDCETDETIANLAEAATICATSSQQPVNATVVVRSAESTVTSGRVFILESRQKLVGTKQSTVATSATADISFAPPEPIDTPTTEQAPETPPTTDRSTHGESTTTTTTSVGNTAPTVSLQCPVGLVNGEEITFTAEATDDDGDDLGYRWFLNGEELDDETSETIVLALDATDRLSVTVDDGQATAEAIVTSCVGQNEEQLPTVTVSCPGTLVFGEEATFVANGVDPAGDANLTYTWYLNGTEVSGVSGAGYTLAPKATDEISVTVTNADGATSAVATAVCVGFVRPSISLECPPDLTAGQPAVFMASADAPDGEDLTYTWRINDEVVADKTASQATLTIDTGDVVSVTVTTEADLTSVAATSTCLDNSSPTVTLECPNPIAFGETTTFVANGIDPDGDSLTYEWQLNGDVLKNETMNSVSISYDDGDTLSVSVTDPSGATAVTDALQCMGTQRPIITLDCPADFQYGAPGVFSAFVAPIVGEPVYTWAINGSIVQNEFSQDIILTLAAGDSVSVNVVDTEGLSSDTTTVGCSPDGEIDVPPLQIPSTPSILGTQVFRVAQGNIAGNLASTGADIAPFVLAGLGALLLGTGVTIVGRRTRRN